MYEDIPAQVIAEVRPGEVDESATAWFTNYERAEEYAQMLRDTGNYDAGEVFVVNAKFEWAT